MPRAARTATAVLVSVWFVSAGAIAASAHEFSRSTSRISVEGRTVRASLTIGATDLHQGPAVDLNGDGFASIEEIDAAIEPVFAAIKTHYRLTADGAAPTSVILDRYGLASPDTLRLDLQLTFAAPVTALAIDSTLHQLTQPDHRHLAHAVIHGTSHEAVLDGSVTHADFQAGLSATSDTAKRFVVLGMEHIATGYDHLAFLVVLLVAATSLLDVVKIVTAFTVAHSITLALATIGLVALPSTMIESLIALSIAWVAVENLLVDHVDRRWRITFVFGLVHGFGFSNVLRDMDLPRASLALSLFAFNAGVEIGQLIFVLVAFPLIYHVLRTRWHPPLALACSSVVFCLGVYWFVQRLLLA
jgi:hypothetical protein